jgi:hypothetical protein
MGMAWSRFDWNLGLQALVIPACRTGAPHCDTSIIIIMA